ncbi:ribosome maturation factor RimM [Inquilinus limosus]|uniref:ribosome maturation factor RimM n=1 Tax=Inquilinus limosus TaxID=171674 RepID=UPI00041EB55C|nr:ribosome maturation factor RimM [Inquilinus limosus]
MSSSSKVCVGQITGAHGVRGLVKVKPFTAAPEDLAAYGPVSDEAGTRHFTLDLLSWAKDQWIVRIDGVADRDAAAALRGLRLYVDRTALPETEEDEFYHADLIGLPAVLADGSRFGTVRAVFDFGAGEMLEIARPGAGAVMVPFTREAVPVVDIAGRRIVIDPPAGLLEPAERPPEDAEPGAGDEA